MVVSIKNETLIAENVEVDMETLRIASSVLEPRLLKLDALMDIRDALLKVLSPEDREKLEAYIKGE